MIYITGDCHGEVLQRFSYNKHPFLKNLTANDTIFVLGDIGLYWPNYEKETEYQLTNINKPWKTIFIAGNHDNYDFIETLPIVQPNFLISGTIRQDKQFYWIDKSCILKIDNKIILCIAGAKSHDSKYIFEKEEKSFIKIAKRRNLPYRINHITWWNQEEIDIKDVRATLKNYGSNKVNYIMSHDAPAHFNNIAKKIDIYNDYEDNEGELFLEELDQTLDFDYWYHGHYHFEDYIYENHVCVYHSILPVK